MRYMLHAPVIDNDLVDLFQEAVKVVVQYDRASSALLQRRLSIGYARAARIMDQLEAQRVVGPSEGNGSIAREVLVKSYEDFLSKGGKRIFDNSPPDEFTLPARYKHPKDIKLTKVPTAPRQQLSDAIKSKDFLKFTTAYPVILGYDEKMLHVTTLEQIGNMIITGNPQSNKENWVDTVLTSLLLTKTPDELRLMLIDPSNYLDLYGEIPHLLSPVISDFSKSVSALRWTVAEMSRRKRLFTQAGVRSIEAYNATPDAQILPRILIVYIYQWGDVESNGLIASIASMGLRAGLHLFVTLNRMSDSNISGDAKANIPNRAVFTVTSPQDSTLAGVKGAESLPEGNALFRIGRDEPRRLLTIYTPEINVKKTVQAVTTAGQK